MKLRLSIKIFIIIYLLMLTAYLINRIYYENIHISSELMIILTIYPIIFSRYTYRVYQYFFKKNDITEVFPNNTLDVLISNFEILHDEIETKFISDYRFTCGGLTIDYDNDNEELGFFTNYRTLYINDVEIPACYAIHPKILKKIHKRTILNRKAYNLKKQQEIINNLKK